MSAELDDWEDLKDAWRNAPVAETNDLASLKASVLRERGRMAFEFAAEVVVALGCAAVFLWWARAADGAERVVLSALALASVASLVVTTILRRRVWRARGETVSAYRDLLRRQTRLGLAFARLGYVGAPLGVVAGSALVETGAVGTVARTPSDTAIAVLACAALVAGFAWSIREARRRRRLLADLAATDAAEEG